MSGGLATFAIQRDDVMKMLACETHLGATNCDFQMEQYVYKRRSDGVHIINISKTWEKLLLAGRAIVSIENPADVCVISARPHAQRALLKFAANTGATPIFGRFTPGCLTNQIQAQFKEPRLLVVSDPRIDHQAITEASYVGVPVIGFCNTDSPLKFVDIAIPCNNKGIQSIGLMWWLLAREVLMMKGKISRSTGFVLDGKAILPDLYFYRDLDDIDVEELIRQEEAKEGWSPQPSDDTKLNDSVTEVEARKIDFTTVPEVVDWAAETASYHHSQEGIQLTGQWPMQTNGSSW